MRTCLLFFALTLLSFATARAAAPNVVIFLADDAGWGDYSSSGNTQVATPHIDSIAKSGVTLDRFYVSPVCSPTRAEFLTGRYHPRTGVWGVSTGQERLNLDESTIAEAFRAAGYATGAFGKWHNGSQWPYHPMARGFQTYFGHTSGHWGEYFDALLEDEGRMVRTHGYIVDVCTDKALAFIDRRKDGPFFCYIPFTTPHSPWAVPEEDWNRCKNRRITQTATAPSQEIENETRCALAMLENQDRNVGRILNKLKELGIEKNTIVLYFSDNGPNTHRWNGGMKGKKAQTDEGGVRSICYIKWPASLPAGHVVPEIAAAIDLLPTLTSLAGVPRVGDKPLDGIDLSPLLRQAKASGPQRKIFSTWGGNVSVRTQSHRMDNQGLLFDMVTDPGQLAPVNRAMPALAAELSGSIETWRKEMFGHAASAPRGYTSDRNQVDPRPIPVGYREFPVTMLPARDGEPHGSVARSSRSPNSSYFVNWTNTTDFLVWNLEVVTRGRYEVAIDYTCPIPDAGSTIELSFRGARLSGKVTPAWDPPLYTNQDTLPRSSAQSKMKEFSTLLLGELELAAGKGALILRATDIPGKSVMDLRRITLTLK